METEENSNEELEAQLYAQVYHDTNVKKTEKTNTFDGIKQFNINRQIGKRYWHTNNSTYKPLNAFHQAASSRSDSSNLALIEIKENAETTSTNKFVPYTSLLSFMNSSNTSTGDVRQKSLVDSTYGPINSEKRKKKSIKFSKKFLNPLNIKTRLLQAKTSILENFQDKKEKAFNFRGKQKEKIVATIEIDDSDESDCLPVELPAPPLISLDSSDEEGIGRMKKTYSPSSSSIISDDFITNGEKNRVITAFRQNELHHASEKLKKIIHQRETMEKAKTLTKLLPSSSSSSSARSSCERTFLSTSVNPIKIIQIDNEDSIYGAKMRNLSTQDNTTNTIESSEEDEIPCVNATKRRRKSTGSGKKSTDQESDKEDIKINNLETNVRVKKRSRLITPRYNDDEFGSMISKIVNNENIEEDSEVEKELNTENEKNKNDASDDCKIFEVFHKNSSVPDYEDKRELETEEKILSDSDDSMKNVSLPFNCDLSLNVTKPKFTQHEYIRDANESTESIAAMNVASLDPEIGWNDEMKYFYYGSWGDENFNLTELYNLMSKNPNFWKISNADRMRTFDNNSRTRCKNCNDFGHIAIRCTQKKKIVCFMCGEENHRETRCPNSICLRCGKPNKMFATVCAACYKLNKRYCPLCRFLGHDIENCPDKWRRYHSTTEETSELIAEYKINPRRYCSICSRKGHFAEECQQFLKTINGLITSPNVRIISHKPSYPKNITNFTNSSETNQQNLALFSYFPMYEFSFNYPSSLKVYKKFLEHFHKFKKVQTTTQMHSISTTEKRVKKCRKKQTKADLTILENQRIEEDSNYSFSDFFESQSLLPEIVSPAKIESEKKHLFKNPIASHDSLNEFPEFISISNYENAKSPKTEITKDLEEISTAKMMLTKEHFSLLNNTEGQKFLQKIQAQYKIIASFHWDDTGNSLSICGTSSNQNSFHIEVKDFLFRIERKRYEKLMEISTQLPKTKTNLVKHLKDNLQSMNKLNIYSAKKMLESMISAEQLNDHRKALKCRKNLNIAFIGHAKLCDGAHHLGALRKILDSLEEDLVQGNDDVSNDVREKIRRHMKPIFGTVDHGDYQKLYFQFKNIKQKERPLNPTALK